MSTKKDDRGPSRHDGKLTLTLPHAYEYTDASKSTFRRLYILTGLVRLIDLGGRSPHILRSELDKAILKIAAAQARDPSLVKQRSGGAVIAARPGADCVANPWGAKGKPAEVAAAERKAARKS